MDEKQLIRGRFRTPWGWGVVTMRGDALLGVDLPWPTETVPDQVTPDPETAAAGDVESAPAADPALARWVGELEAYFGGDLRRWSAADLDLDLIAGTTFRRAVYEALLAVPPGETVSYGELAARAGRPGAARAVGSAMAENPVAIVIPCHRVVRADGAMGRYGQCDALKPYLLAHEGAGGGDR